MLVVIVRLFRCNDFFVWWVIELCGVLLVFSLVFDGVCEMGGLLFFGELELWLGFLLFLFIYVEIWVCRFEGWKMLVFVDMGLCVIDVCFFGKVIFEIVFLILCFFEWLLVVGIWYECVVVLLIVLFEGDIEFLLLYFYLIVNIWYV